MIDKSSFFKFSMMNCHYVRYPLEYFFDNMVKHGIKNIELFGGMPHFYIEDVDTDLINHVKTECTKRGLSITSYTPAQGAYPVSLASGETRVRKRSIDMAMRCIQTAHRLGTDKMILCPGAGYETQSHEQRWALCRDSLEQLADYAKTLGVTLMIEPLTTNTSNVINTSAQAARMIHEVGSPYLKSIMDIGVMEFMGESVDEYFQNLGDDLVHIHFSDGPGMHLALGDGTFSLDKYAEQIIAHKYKGLLSFEINDKRYFAQPDIATEKNITWLKKHNYETF